MSEPEKRPHWGKAATILVAGILLTFLWFCFWENGALCWSLGRSVLPPRLYFQAEEFLALSNHNSPWCMAGGALIVFGFMIWALRANGRVRFREGALLGLIAAALLVLLTPCLCAPREVGRRADCLWRMRQTYLELREKYPDKLPDRFPLQRRDGHTVRYGGAGKSLQGPRFILFEDADPGHAGDMRHRFWSDGVCEQFYPWKNGSAKPR